ncbi:23S rRNA (uracil(1939)-C(5))-methyltransferase RlmD [Adlercreutzia sp. ZJ154]|uniref:23S rRNA (uracil(1939)-C(5))-methyltransferase RlmD n=1 Tax=Adlercreutzia sp. ZJ154 TaxID=2709790 RepID=UPI0013EA06E3|nr:23S rRNA (uracil(1939)-C(5))-methyltransferase RlmD [Adlercreutzia sp. ZJ154]
MNKSRKQKYPQKHPASDVSACAVSARCGACTMIDIPYDEQLAKKQAYIEELFAGLASPKCVRPIIGMQTPYHYRNKVVSPFAPARGARPGAFAVATGMYAQGTHKLVPTDGCLIENETGKRVVQAVRSLMLKWKIAPYNEDTGEGFLRHAVVRVGQFSGEVLVTLVTNSDQFPFSKSFCRELVRRVPEITTVVQNVNTRQTNVILGETERVLYGPGFILDGLCGLTFRISSQSFYQVNVCQTEALYTAAIDAAKLNGTQTVIDAYCGTGTIGLVAAARGAARVLGLDCVESAIRDARQNAKHNGITNAEFFVEDATDFLVRAARCGIDGAKSENMVLMMDPPRSGSTPQFLNAACALAPSRIVYISCNPKTQVRDAENLLQSGYTIESIQPVDMFPHTDHVECVVLMSREKLDL